MLRGPPQGGPIGVPVIIVGKEGEIAVTWLEGTLLGNSFDRWLLALGIAVGLLVLIGIARSVIARRFRPIAARTSTFADDAIVLVAERTNLGVLAIPAIYLGALSLRLPASAVVWGRAIAIIAALVQVAIWGRALIDGWVLNYQQHNLEDNAGRVGTARVMSFVAQLVFFSVIVLLALDNIPGVEITTLVASLGIGGIAVALAVQNILSDLFASLSIALDKPFVLGDFIVLDDLAGTVDQIGLRSTRLRSLAGEQLIISNTDLLSGRIHNYKRMQERRIVFSLGVLYETPAAKLRAIPALIRGIVEAQEQTRFDRAHFKSLDDFALTFEVVYYVLTPNYNTYMDTQQAINLMIFERFAAAGIGFAYPTQTIYAARAATAGGQSSNGAGHERELNRS